MGDRYVKEWETQYIVYIPRDAVEEGEGPNMVCFKDDPLQQESAIRFAYVERSLRRLDKKAARCGADGLEDQTVQRIVQ